MLKRNYRNLEYVIFFEFQPQIIYPGSFELEALASGVLRVLNNKETAKKYQWSDLTKKFMILFPDMNRYV